MGSNKIPSQNLDDFMRNFSYNGYTRADVDRKNSHTNNISDDFYETPEKLKGLQIKGAQIHSDWRNKFSSSDRFSYVDRIKEEDGLIKVQGQKRYSQTFIREQDLSRSSVEIENLDDYAFYRQDNKLYGAQRPISNQVSDDSSGDELMLTLIDDLSNDIKGDSRLNVYQRVDEAIEMAEKLQDSSVSINTRKEATKDLIQLFVFMDEVITNDINRLAAIRNADKANRGQNTGLQTAKEKDAIQQMSFRTTERGELVGKLGDLKSDLVSLDVFNRL